MVRDPIWTGASRLWTRTKYTCVQGSRYTGAHGFPRGVLNATLAQKSRAKVKRLELCRPNHLLHRRRGISALLRLESSMTKKSIVHAATPPLCCSISHCSTSNDPHSERLQTLFPHRAHREASSWASSSSRSAMEGQERKLVRTAYKRLETDDVCQVRCSGSVRIDSPSGLTLAIYPWIAAAGQAVRSGTGSRGRAGDCIAGKAAPEAFPRHRWVRTNLQLLMPTPCVDCAAWWLAKLASN